MDTYAQLQEIRTYYKFLDVDIDRYSARRRLPAGDAVGARTCSPRCCRPMRRPGSTGICCSPTATAW